MIDTFSANSLKMLDKSPDEFLLKYKDKLCLQKDVENTKAGRKFHALIQYYIEGFNIDKMEKSLSCDDKILWQNIKNNQIFNDLSSFEFIKCEYPFFVKFKMPNTLPCAYLTGRFDCAAKKDNLYTIYDWKIKNIPKNPEDDIQTVVYLYGASKLFKSEKISIVYYSLKENITKCIHYDNEKNYEKTISTIISKYYNKNS